MKLVETLREFLLASRGAEFCFAWELRSSNTPLSSSSFLSAEQPDMLRKIARNNHSLTVEAQ